MKLCLLLYLPVLVALVRGNFHSAEEAVQRARDIAANRPTQRPHSHPPPPPPTSPPRPPPPHETPPFLPQRPMPEFPSATAVPRPRPTRPPSPPAMHPSFQEFPSMVVQPHRQEGGGSKMYKQEYNEYNKYDEEEYKKEEYPTKKYYAEYYTTPKPWYKPRIYHKRQKHPSVDPAPLPAPLKLFYPTSKYERYSDTPELPRQPFIPPSFEIIPTVTRLPYYKPKYSNYPVNRKIPYREIYNKPMAPNVPYYHKFPTYTTTYTTATTTYRTTTTYTTATTTYTTTYPTTTYTSPPPYTPKIKYDEPKHEENQYYQKYVGGKSYD